MDRDEFDPAAPDIAAGEPSADTPAEPAGHPMPESTTTPSPASTWASTATEAPGTTDEPTVDTAVADEVTDESVAALGPSVSESPWSGTDGEPTEDAPTQSWWPAEPPKPAARQRTGSGMRNLVVAALIGALVGAGVAGGIVAAVDDDGGSTTIVRSSDNVPARASTTLSRPGDISAIIEKVKPAVVRIDAGSGFQQGTGTGFIVSASGVIVTNAHVVEGSDTVQVTFDDGDTVDGEVLGSSATVDLAVVKVERTGLPTVELGDSDELQVGDAVVAIGNALGLSDGSGLTVTTGIVSGLDRTVDLGVGETLLNAIQTDAAINPGNSGGPLLDSEGRVIGINTAIANPGSSNNIGFAIAISSAEPIVEDLRAGREPRIAFLGVRTQTVTPSLAEGENLSTESGALVVEVTPGSGADEGGIEAGDVIVEIDGQQVERDDQVLRAVRGHHPGDEIAVVVVRGETRESLTVTLGNFEGEL